MAWNSKRDLSNPNAQYTYCANGPSAALFSILFGLIMIAHLVQAIIRRKRFCWVIIMATTWECFGLVLRTYSTTDQVQSNSASAGQLLVLLAPLWINAFVYMMFGRMMYYYLPHKKIAGIRAESLAKLFIWLDLMSFIVQATGGIMDSDFSSDINEIGRNIYIGGTAMQEFFILCFCTLLITFYCHMQRDARMIEQEGNWKVLAIVMFITLGFITIRIIYRLAEYANLSTINTIILTNKEVFFYVLECLPMFCGMVLWNIWHPGRLLQCGESHFPQNELSRKERTNRKNIEEV